MNTKSVLIATLFAAAAGSVFASDYTATAGNPEVQIAQSSARSTVRAAWTAMAVAVLAIALPASAQTWPARPVTLVVGTPAAYVLARYDFKFKEDLAFTFLSFRFAPELAVIMAYAKLDLFSLLIAAASLGLSLAFDEYPMPIAIMVAVISVGSGVGPATTASWRRAVSMICFTELSRTLFS